jgi:imidazole glycerol-phosphate synthase subunit HisH
MSVVIVDYGMSNLNSIQRALEECGAQNPIAIDNPRELRTADRIVLPGVGAFGDGIEHLKAQGWIEVIREEVLENKIPLLGICLGMQLLASKGFESGQHDGLDLIPGNVKKLEPIGENEKIPHVGWNEVHYNRDNHLFNGIPDGRDFYFVHSYHFVPDDPKDIIGTTPYCGGVVSAVNRGNVFGTQFHPEKSIPSGFDLIKNFLNY